MISCIIVEFIPKYSLGIETLGNQDESLLATHIEEQELSELLNRLSASQCGLGQPNITIREVAEATDLPPVQIARTLQQIRSEVTIPPRIDLHHDLLEAEKEKDRRFLLGLIIALIFAIVVTIAIASGHGSFS